MSKNPKPEQNMFFFVLVLCCFSNVVVLGSSDSIYEALLEHGLPAGLFPKGAKDFRIDDKRRFEVHLDYECNAKFESELHYERNISGTLSYGQIADLEGVLAQDLFLWFRVKKIRVDVPSSGLIYFDVDVVYKQFPLSLFETPPDCVAGVIDGSSSGLAEARRVDQVAPKSVLRNFVSGSVRGNLLIDVL